MILCVCLITTACTLAASSASASSCATLGAAKALWETHMVQAGSLWGTYLNPSSRHTADELLATDYYDGQWVFQQIAAYTGKNSPWVQYAEYARRAYVVGYLMPSGFRAQGHRRFPHGMYFDFKSGGPTTLAQLIQLRDLPAYSNLYEFVTSANGTAQSKSREISYAIQANVYAERAGSPRKIEARDSHSPWPAQPVPEVMVSWVPYHFQQWMTARYLPEDLAAASSGGVRFAPFMAALELHALIDWIEWEEANRRDPNRVWPTWAGRSIVDSMANLLNWMYQASAIRAGPLAGSKMYQPAPNGPAGGSTFYYEDLPENATGLGDPNGTSGPALAWPLNNLVAYPYAWVATRLAAGTPDRRTTAQTLMTVADELFIGAANSSAVTINGKMFNQNYRLSIKYIALHDQAGLGLCSASLTKAPAITPVH